MTPLRKKMIEDLTVRNRSENTIESYVGCVASFARHLGRSPEVLGPEDIKAYQLYLIRERKVAWSTFNVHVCALKFLYGVTLGRQEVVEVVPYAKRPKKLPSVLSQDEVCLVLKSIDRIVPRTVLTTAYSGGLRLTESVTLQVPDIDSSRMLIHVRQGKGQKDRLVPLSVTLLDLLRAYYRIRRPDTFLFPGSVAEAHISQSAVQGALRRAVKVAGIRRHVTVHTLRHSYATHMLEAGTDLRTIQAILGHSRIGTTEIYTHVQRHKITATKSPLDLMDMKR